VLLVVEVEVQQDQVQHLIQELVQVELVVVELDQLALEMQELQIQVAVVELVVPLELLMQVVQVVQE
tara:strand:- start:44 stop:244 length:201 start_codon:yes stop_codon:yes gene_type:complete